MQSISSQLTIVYKVVFPLALTVAFAFSVPALLAGAGARDVEYSVVWLIALGFVLWICGPLKQVAIDQTDVIISGFFRKTRVPLANIADVSENRWLNIRPIRIRFDIDTPFGNSIVFMPHPLSPFKLFSPHPIVADLRALAAKNRDMRPRPTDTEPRPRPALPDRDGG